MYKNDADGLVKAIKKRLRKQEPDQKRSHKRMKTSEGWEELYLMDFGQEAERTPLTYMIHPIFRPQASWELSWGNTSALYHWSMWRTINIITELIPEFPRMLRGPLCNSNPLDDSDDQ